MLGTQTSIHTQAPHYLGQECKSVAWNHDLSNLYVIEQIYPEIKKMYPQLKGFIHNWRNVRWQRDILFYVCLSVRTTHWTTTHLYVSAMSFRVRFRSMWIALKVCSQREIINIYSSHRRTTRVCEEKNVHRFAVRFHFCQIWLTPGLIDALFVRKFDDPFTRYMC